MSLSLQLDTEIELDIVCNVCKKSLEIVTEDFNGRKNLASIKVSPCVGCMEENFDSGFDQGKESNRKFVEGPEL